MRGSCRPPRGVSGSFTPSSCGQLTVGKRSPTVSAPGTGTDPPGVVRSSHTQGYREPFAQSPAAIGYDVDPSSPTAPTGGPCDGKLVGVVVVPPPRARKETKRRHQKKGRTPEPESSQGNPSPQGDSGVVSVSQPPDHSQQTEQPTATPMPQLCSREVVTDSRESKAAAKGWQGTAAGPTPPEPVQTRCLLTVC